jgi:hypothetical protein
MILKEVWTYGGVKDIFLAFFRMGQFAIGNSYGTKLNISFSNKLL